MRRKQDDDTHQALRDATRYGEGAVSLLDCRSGPTDPPCRFYEPGKEPIVKFHLTVQSLVLTLLNRTSVPVRVTGVETDIHDSWWMRDDTDYRLLADFWGEFDLFLGESGTQVHPVEFILPPGRVVDLPLRYASTIARPHGMALYAMRLCVHYEGGWISEDSPPMVLAVHNPYEMIDTEPGGPEVYDPDPQAESLPAGLRNWNALRRFKQYPGQVNLEFLKLYREYAMEAATGKWCKYTNPNGM